MARPTRRELEATFFAYNKLLFGGKLPYIPVHRRRMACNAFWEEPTDADPRYPTGLICISTSVEMTCGWQGALLHEQIHASCYYKGGPDEFALGESPDHGPHFTAEANRVGALLGFPPVCVDLAWNWPECLDLDFWPEPAVDE